MAPLRYFPTHSVIKTRATRFVQGRHSSLMHESSPRRLPASDKAIFVLWLLMPEPACLARVDSAMLVDAAGASRENSRRDGYLTCPGPRLCLGASHLYAGGCSDARARRHLGLWFSGWLQPLGPLG